MASSLFSFLDNHGLTFLDGFSVSQSVIPNTLGGWGRITHISITLTGLTHTFPDDLDFLLWAGPRGTNLEFWSDAGGDPNINGSFTIADSGASSLPDAPFVPIASGTYRPTDYDSPTPETDANWVGVGLPGNVPISHPAPGGPATFASAFGGAWLGSTWNLSVTDDAFMDTGSLASWFFLADYNTVVKPDDFNGNNFSDILWQRSDGLPAIWLMNGLSTVFVGGAGSFNPGPSWQIKSNGDFDGDGRSDILWQNSDGTPAIWLMNGLSAVSVGAAGPFNPGPSWQIKATGDFNFDTKSDILWQSSDGTPAIWLMDGLNALFTGAVGPFNPGPSWQIKATGDFNSDGRSDIVWQNSDGTPALWFMDGVNTTFHNVVAGGFNPGPSWQIKGTGDFNGDGMSDILWQGSDGTPAIWLMDGMNFISGSAAGAFNPGHDWHVIA